MFKRSILPSYRYFIDTEFNFLSVGPAHYWALLLTKWAEFCLGTIVGYVKMLSILLVSFVGVSLFYYCVYSIQCNKFKFTSTVDHNTEYRTTEWRTEQR